MEERGAELQFFEGWMGEEVPDAWLLLAMLGGYADYPVATVIC